MKKKKKKLSLEQKKKIISEMPLDELKMSLDYSFEKRKRWESYL